MAMPRGGRPLVMLNWIPASWTRWTASAARFVRTCSCARNIVEQLVQFGRTIQEFRVDRRFNGTGGYRVDGDLVRGWFDGEVSRQHLDSAFARAIRGEMRGGEFLVPGAYVDHFPGAICF